MYGKIFEMMYEGSLYGQWEAIVTFQQMIVIADDEGFVDITPQSFAAKTSIPLDIIMKGIEILESDDPYSRTEGDDGKRILRINEKRPWGWQIVNYKKYRDMASYEDRKAYMRQYMRNRRKQEALTSKQPVNNDKQTVADVTHTDKYTNINTFGQFWGAYPKKRHKGQAQKTWDNLVKKKKLPEINILIRAIELQKETPDWKKENGKYIPYPATWLNAEGWLDEIEEIKCKTPVWM